MTKKQKHPEKVTTDLIIVGPMPFPWKSLKTYLNNPDSKLIFIDGGIKHWEKFKKKAPQLLKTSMTVGDGDSSQKVMTLKKVSQNTSDLGFLLSKLGKKSEHARFMLVGFLGGRLDHQLFNLGEITLFLKKFNQANSPSICMDDKIQFLSAGIHHVCIDGIFSLAGFEPGSIKIEGNCEYTSKNWLKLPTMSSQGLSNLGQGEIKISTKTPLMIIKNLLNGN